MMNIPQGSIITQAQPRLGTIWWLSQDSHPPSKRERGLINAVLKEKFPESILFGTALAGKNPSPLVYESHRHLVAEIGRIHQQGGVIFVSDDAGLPDAALVNGLYVIDNGRVYHREDGRSVLAWPVASN